MTNDVFLVEGRGRIYMVGIVYVNISLNFPNMDEIEKIFSIRIKFCVEREIEREREREREVNTHHHEQKK
jgi:hypothetical protein